MPTSTTKVLLIRHAESAPNPDLPEPEWPLSPEGERQAQALAETLNVDCLYASPYGRAIGTLSPAAERLGLSIETVQDLRERKLAGELLKDWRASLQRSWEDFDVALPGGESSRTCQTRVVNALKEIVQANEGRTIAAASHGNAIALFLNHLNPDFGFDQWEAMQNPHVFELAYANRTWSLIRK
ncbi:MAG: histidine phosphatase family protein [Pseudomonadota bacterium]